MNVVTLGGYAVLAGVIGDDDAGAAVARLLRDKPRAEISADRGPGPAHDSENAVHRGRAAIVAAG